MPLKIYYVDDEAAICENFADFYSSPDTEISTFCNAHEAIKAVRANPPDLIILDYRMPEMTGDQIAKEMKTDKPIVLYTGELELKTDYPFRKIIRKSADLTQVSKIIEEVRLNLNH